MVLRRNMTRRRSLVLSVSWSTAPVKPSAGAPIAIAVPRLESGPAFIRRFCLWVGSQQCSTRIRFSRRLHGSLGMMTPAEYENTHYATLNREPQPA